MGNAASMTPEQWQTDITEAQKAHIDGFALNIGPQDTYTDQVLDNAYNAAETVGNFTMFLSFDYGSAGPWPVDRVISTINKYKNSRAQFYYEGRPLVSTFEGAANAADWPSIKSATGCMVIPSWTSLGPLGLAPFLNDIDGHFSWDAWPSGAEDKDTLGDQAWMAALAGKPYMMPISPWFYTNLPQWNKNWLWRGDDLWHDRWQQIIELQPALVEVWVSSPFRSCTFPLLTSRQILTWNDYGESHYIGPIYEDGIPEGASRYVSGNSHDAWRNLLPYYIDAYKSGNATSPAPTDDASDKITYWYRPNPANAGSSDGTTGNNPSYQEALSPALVSQDKVFLTVLVSEPSTITVQIGDAEQTVLRAVTAGINHFSVPFNGETGPVHFAIVRDGQPVVMTTGPAITDQCGDGAVNWNAIVGSSD